MSPQVIYWHSKWALPGSQLSVFWFSSTFILQRFISFWRNQMWNWLPFVIFTLSSANFPRQKHLKSAVKRLTSRLTGACENDVLWSHYATSSQWDSISHKNTLLRKSVGKKRLLFNTYPPVSPKSIFELTGIFHRLLPRQLHCNYYR